MKFWDFRVDDIGTDMLNFYLLVSVLFLINAAVVFFISPTQSFLITLLVETILCALTIAVWLVRTRIRKYISSIILLLVSITLVLSVLDFANLSLEPEVSSLETAKVILRARLAIQSILIAPSLGMFFTYQAIYGCMVLLTYLLIIINDSDSTEMERLLYNMPSFCIVQLFLFYVLQKRELKRFYQQRKSEKKESQLNSVLNSHSEAIIVVEAPKGVKGK